MICSIVEVDARSFDTKKQILQLQINLFIYNTHWKTFLDRQAKQRILGYFWNPFGQFFPRHSSNIEEGYGEKLRQEEDINYSIGPGNRVFV